MAVSLNYGSLLKVMPAVALLVALSGCGSGEKPEQRSPQAPLPAPPISAAPQTPGALQARDTRPVVAAFGDSLSAGFGLDPGQSFPDDLQRLIDAAGYNYRVVNMGVSGDTTSDGVERLPSVLALHPAVVILEFGGNDGLRGQPVTLSAANMDHMIQALRAAHASVLVAGMTLPRNYGPEYIHSFEQMFVDLANKYNLVRIPFLLDGVGGHSDLMQPDGLHPTARGAEIVAHTVMGYLAPLLGSAQAAERGAK